MHAAVHAFPHALEPAFAINIGELAPNVEIRQFHLASKSEPYWVHRIFALPGLATPVGQGQENHSTLPNNRELSRAKSRAWRGTWPLYHPQVPKSCDYFTHESQGRSILLSGGLSILEKAEQRRAQGKTRIAGWASGRFS